MGTGPHGTPVTARETTALIAMGQGHALLAHGHSEAAAWMITRWYDGPSTWQALHAVRAGVGLRSAALSHMIGLCEAVARLHQDGWVHADLQPAHALHTPSGVRLIDCSWAWHPEKLAPSPLFHGGRPHFLAPELALSIHEGERPVAPSQPSEVYTLAATLWTAITGDWPLDYAHIGVDPAALAPADLRRIISTGTIPLHGPWSWPDVQDILSDVLTQPAEHRPTAAELASRLRSLPASC